MASTSPPTSPPPLSRGTYAPSTASDLRGPCPVVNSLANHGYIPRDGRNVLAGELRAAMDEVGLSYALGCAFAHPIFLEHVSPTPPAAPRSLLGRLWHLLRHPVAALFARFGMRRPGQRDRRGAPCLNLDQLALHGAVEHDVSLTRHDLAEGNNCSPQPELIRQLLDSSSDGGATLSAQDLAGCRRRRIEQQRAKPHALTYGKDEHHVACAEIALILDVFGDGQKVSCDRVRAIFTEERLPIKEGWKKRGWWWTYGFPALLVRQTQVAKLIGLKVE